MQQTKQTRTTIHLTIPDPRRFWNLPTPVAAALVTFALIAIAALVGRIQQAPAAAPTIAPTASLPIVVIQKEQLPAVPQAAQVQPAAPVVLWVVGFDAPNGTALGAIPAPTLDQITARWGDGWIQTTHDGAPIWIRVADLGAQLGDIRPAPAVQAQPVYAAAPAPAYTPAYVPEPQYQVANDQQPPASPPEQPDRQPALVAAPAAAPAAQPALQDQPVVVPNPGWFYQQTPEQMDQQRIQWEAEHCHGSGDSKVCH